MRRTSAKWWFYWLGKNSAINYPPRDWPEWARQAFFTGQREE